MESSKFNSLYCPIRGIRVSASPEERVRQRLIVHMLGPLGYPKGHLAVEKNFFDKLIRRIDLVCFYPVQDLLKPLLLVECKAERLSKEAENQLFGYNAEIKAPFLCLVSSKEIKLFWREKRAIKSLPFLPSYTDLIEKV